MKTLKDEWLTLAENLSPEQQQDGERCFYCGALTILAEIPNGLPFERLQALHQEIRNHLMPKRKDEGL